MMILVMINDAVMKRTARVSFHIENPWRVSKGFFDIQ
jgi:hypothetical protein